MDEAQGENPKDMPEVATSTDPRCVDTGNKDGQQGAKTNLRDIVGTNRLEDRDKNKKPNPVSSRALKPSPYEGHENPHQQLEESSAVNESEA